MKKASLLILYLALGCITLDAFAQETELKFTVSAAPEWTELFKRTNGWFGGDGIYTIPLDGVKYTKNNRSKTLFIFSDSMIGEIQNGQLKSGSKMLHNTTAVLTGTKPLKEHIHFFWNKNDGGEPVTIFVPQTPKTGPTDYYWLGDGFVNQEVNNSLFIFGYRVKQVNDGTFGFSEVGNTLIKIAAKEKQPFQHYEQKDTPFHLKDDKGEMASYGAGIFVNTKKAGAPKPDGFVYVYGVKGSKKELLAARVLPKDFEDFDKWTFWNGTKWIPSIADAAEITDQVSNELSVSPLPDGRYALIFQQGGMGKTVGMRVGTSPIGPFGPVIKLWDCSADLTQKTYFAYNAKAHPSLSDNGELLISYNINSFDFFKDLGKDANLYRPRFIKVKFN